MNADPICGNCGKPRSEHFTERYSGESELRLYCELDTTADIFTDEPSRDTLFAWMETHNPETLRLAKLHWQDDNGHGTCDPIPTVRQGWREFHCDDCDYTFTIPSRDYKSPSGEGCLKCNEDVKPRDSWMDPSIPVDAHGNIEIAYRILYDEWLGGMCSQKGCDDTGTYQRLSQDSQGNTYTTHIPCRWCHEYASSRYNVNLQKRYRINTLQKQKDNKHH